MGDGTRRIGIKVKAGDKDVDVQIEIDEEAAKGNIKVGREKTDLTGLKKGKDGKRVEGRTKLARIIELTVVITIDCDKDPAEIRIVATNKKGEVLKDSTYTFSHAEQDRLVEFLTGTKIPELALAEPPASGGAVATGSGVGATLATVAIVAAVATVGLSLVLGGGPGGTPASPTPIATGSPTAAATATPVPTETATPTEGATATPAPTPTPPPTQTPAPTLTPTPTPTPPPTLAALTLEVDPTVVSLGSAGAKVFISGDGFTPGGRVTKAFVPPRGAPFSFETQADADGHLAATLTLSPDQTVGRWTVIATDEATGREVRAGFEVHP